ncbi:MAG: type IV pilus assembly protein PilM [Candidatus Spyradenecus sp.]
MERILTLNIGATRLALAEFEVRPGKGPNLLRYAFGEVPEGLTETPDSLAVGLEQALRALMASAGIRAGRTLVSLSGQMAFPRFVKVLAETPEKVREQIRFEVEQNVPFPLSEAIWSDALIGEPLAGEQHVMIVAARADIVSAVTKALLNAGCEPEVVDVAPVALYNGVRFNYPEADGCTLVVDIGARCTNLVFVEQDRIFYRTIPVAGNTITSEIAKTFGLSQEDAELFKCERGLVAQGGAFAVDDPDVDRLSKVIRNVMTRLNAEVTRSIAFYRSQQEGNAPVRVLLTGASAQLPYMQNFFEEKLQVEVDFLNPFQTVGYPSHIDAEQFGRDAFSLPALVGLALRRGLSCPVEINLVSQDIAARKTFRKRIPFLTIAALGLLVSAGIWLVYVNNIRSLYENQSEKIQRRIDDHQELQEAFDRVDKQAKRAQARAEAYRTLLQKRGEWMGMLTAVNRAIPGGLWLTSLKANREGSEVKGLNLSVSVWKDLEETRSTAGKTIDETVAARLAEQSVFADDPKQIPISKKDQSLPWMTSFNITANLKAAEADQAKKSTSGRSRRSR